MLICARLGHGSIRTTMDTYGHLFPGWDDKLIEDLASLMRDAEFSNIVSPTRPKRALQLDECQSTETTNTVLTCSNGSAPDRT